MIESQGRQVIPDPCRNPPLDGPEDTQPSPLVSQWSGPELASSTTRMGSLRAVMIRNPVTFVTAAVLSRSKVRRLPINACAGKKCSMKVAFLDDYQNVALNGRAQDGGLVDGALCSKPVVA
jgi:hypothetical protein